MGVPGGMPDSKLSWETAKLLVAKNPVVGFLALLNILVVGPLLYLSSATTLWGLVVLTLVVLGSLVAVFLKGESWLAAMGLAERLDNPPADVAARLHSLNQEEQTVALQALSFAREEVASLLRMDESLVRSNFFSSADDHLLMVPGMTQNLDRPEERSLRLSIGQGCTGLAFKERKPVLGVRDPNTGDWGEYQLAHPDMAALDPELRWIVSVPVLTDDKRVLGVLNVDGLGEERTADQLTEVVARAVAWGFALRAIIGSPTPVGA